MTKDRLWRIVKGLAPLGIVAILGLALLLLYGELKRYSYQDIARSLAGYPALAITLAGAFTVLNYLVLTCFDSMGLRYAGATLSWPRTAFTSFLSYVFSSTVGLSIFGASVVRMRFYSSWGIEPGRIAKIIGFCVFSFWVGLLSMGSLTFLLSPPTAAPGLPGFLAWGKGIGLVLATAIAIYLGLCATVRKGVLVRGVELRLPSLPLALGQVLAGCLDWLFAGLALHALLPAPGLGFFHFLPVFMIAQIAAVTSHVPGGLGVFETIIVLSLSPAIPSDRLLAALLVYRLVYYLAPLFLAFLGFLGAEILRKRGALADQAQSMARLVLPALPSILAGVAFLAGALLLVSVSTPTHPDRLRLVNLILPLGVMELSHFAASLTGLGLLLLAGALNRRIDAAWFLSCILLASGAAFSLLRGFRYEEAILLLLMLACLVPMRSLFHRRAAVLTRHPSPAWIAGILVVLACSAWIGFFSWKHVEYSGELWWQVELQAGAPRFLRAALGVSILGLFIAVRSFLAANPSGGGEALSDCREAVRACIAANDAAGANLALLGDKLFFWAADRRAFIMYGTSGRSRIALGDPVGDPAAFPDLLWRFFEDGSRSGARVVFYEVSSRHLPLYLELGLTLLKTGEQARVPLGDFSLDGGRRAKLRTPWNKMQREGYAFGVLEGREVEAAMDELEGISRAWLAEKGAKEKGFSLGRFDRDYLRNFPVAVIRKEGAIRAFSNIWTTGTGKDIAIDLMRHDPEAPNGVMEFLFTGIMLWGRERGYGWFDLGIAPMSGIRQSEAAPLWSKAISLLYHSGAGAYSFEGLRRFKEKFDPAWSPAYLVSKGRFSVPLVAAEIAALVARTDSPPLRSVP